MWLRLIRSHGLQATKMAAVVDDYRRDDLPALQQAPGFLGIAMGENHVGGSISSVTFWDSEQAMRDTEGLSAQARERAVPVFDVEDPMLVDHFEVTFVRELDVAAFAGKPMMRLVRFRGLTPETVNAAADSYRADAERLLPQTRGVLRIAIGINRAAGTAAIITFWASVLDMRDAERASVEAREHATKRSGAARTPLVESFEVTLDGLESLADLEPAPPAGAPVADIAAPPLVAVAVPEPVAPPERDEQFVTPPEPERAQPSVATPAAAPVRGTGVFARITRHTGLTPERLAALTRSVEERLLPRIEAQEGFSGALILADHRAGESVGITLWDSPAALQASEAAAADVREAIEDELGHAKPPTVLQCELIDGRPWEFFEGEKPVARLQRHPGLTPEAMPDRIQRLQEQQLPAVEDELGFAGAAFFVSVSETQLLAVSLWENARMYARSDAASRQAREAIDAGLPGTQKLTSVETEVIASRPWSGAHATA